VVLGDLVKSKRYNAMGIVVDIFGDLDGEDPWVRVLFTVPAQHHQWCKFKDLTVISPDAVTDLPPTSSL